MGRVEKGGRAAVAVCIAGCALPLWWMFTSPRLLDEQYLPYLSAARYGLNPVRTFVAVMGDTADNLRFGTFRPVGRAAYYIEMAVTFRLARATSVPIQVIRGLICSALLTLVLYLIGVTGRVLLRREHAWRFDTRTLAALIPALVVASAAGSPGTHPFVLITTRILASQALILVAVIAIIRASTSAERTQATIARLVLLGMVCAAWYDLVYIVLPTAAVAFAQFRLAERTLEPQPSGFRSLASRVGAAFRHRSLPFWSFVSGFAAVFVPTRLAIAAICSGPEAGCYKNTDIVVSFRAIPAMTARLLAGTPVASLVAVSTSPAPGLPLWQGPITAVVGVAVAAALVVGVQKLGSERRAALGAALPTLAAMWIFGAILSGLGESLQSKGFQPLVAFRDSGAGYLLWATALIVVGSRLTRGRTTKGLAILAVPVLAASLLSVLGTRRMTDYLHIRGPGVTITDLDASMIAPPNSPRARSFRCSALEAYLRRTARPDGAPADNESQVARLLVVAGRQLSSTPAMRQECPSLFAPIPLDDEERRLAGWLAGPESG